MEAGALFCDRIVGHRQDPDLAAALHRLDHAGALETVVIASADATRRRMRVATDHGRPCMIALDRRQLLADGAVLHLSETLAVVVRVDTGRRLRLVPRDIGSALRLGHWCGNLHWRVDFVGGALEVHLEGPEEAYRARLRDLADHASFETESPR